MIARGLLGLALALAATAASAQLEPLAPIGDPRLQAVDFDAGRVTTVRAAPGYQVTIELNADERVENIAVGDSAAWQATTNRRGDHIFVKALQGAVSTNMTVMTSVRLYAFDLVPGNAGDMPYTLRFRYPGQGTAEIAATPADRPPGRYKVSGAAALRPSAISDDGTRTFIEWPEDVALPAVYALNARNQEELVNGNMRDGLYVIDSIVPRLVFRIDNAAARAVRVRKGKG